MRWVGPEHDPRLMKPFPSDLMKMWPIDSKVGSPRNNTPDTIDEIGRGRATCSTFEPAQLVGEPSAP